MGRIEEAAGAKPASEVILASLRRALESQRRISEDTGRHAETLLVSGDRILTHCFAGPALLYMLRMARENGKDVRVICTETRPYLQGARLTAWSVSELGIDTTLITDNMAAHCMSKGMVSKVFAAADRVAMDGVVANKVGTLQLAICAQLLQNPLLHSRLRRAGQADALRRRHPDRGAGPEGGSRVPGHTHQRPRREGLLPGLRPHAGGAGDGNRDGKWSGAEEEIKKGGDSENRPPLPSRPGFRAILSMFNH